MRKNTFSMAHREMRCAGALSKLLCTAVVFCATSHLTYGQTPEVRDSAKVQRLQTVIISDSRVSNKIPLTTSTVDKDDLLESRGNVNIPYMLETLPSVVASGENGTVGATYIRIRGVDATRINVNINGITLNDPESQSVFWYNIPNFGGMAQSMQIQRGLGASTGGSPAFGAAINMQTLNAANKPYGVADVGYGSWNTHQYSVAAGTGILKNGLSFDFAYSGLTSDGFVRGGFTHQQSFFGSLAWYGERTLIKLVTIIGAPKAGITWDGASAEDLDKDPTYNPSGAYHVDGNTFYYNNESDNYLQQHYQLYLSHLLSDRWSVKGVLNYTRGDGYYEQYKEKKKFSKYDIDKSGKSDFIIRKEMYNDGITGAVSLNYNSKKLNFTLGDNMLYFDGYHWGNVIWCRDTSLHIDMPYEWYRYHGTKVDNSVYAKANYSFSDNFNTYADMQLRIINYKLAGLDDDLFTMDFDEDYIFFNPKAGLNYRINDHNRTYFVAGISHREPPRSDIKDALNPDTDIDTVCSEAMLDLELGYQMAYRRGAFNVNVYAMLYKNQLTPNGDLSSSGYALMENVDRSYRIGVELEGKYEVCRWLRMDANLTLSQNKVLDYTFADFSDGDDSPNLVTRTTDLALSPNVVGAVIATISPVKNARLQLIGKYVGKQFADNTSRECYAVDPYFLLNLRASYTWHLNNSNQIEAQLTVNNLLNHNYRLSAWVADWVDDYSGPAAAYYYHSSGWLQQPGRNFMARVIYKF